MGRFNPWLIVEDHWATLRKYRGFSEGEKVGIAWGTVTFQALVPTLVAGLLIAAGRLLTESLVGILITSLSIFAALLFNLLILVYDIVRKEGSTLVWRLSGNHTPDGEASAPKGLEPDTERVFAAVRRKFLREIFANLSFAVLTSLLVVTVLMLWLMVEQWLPGWGNAVLAGASYFGITLFLLTFFLVLRRVHILLSDQFKHMRPGALAPSEDEIHP